MSTLPPDSAPSPATLSGTDHDALPPGTRFGEFEIIRVLGVGGFGIVYLANDHSLEREVALKEYMPASLAARGLGPQITVRSSSFAETYAIGLRSFVNEARLLARFDHPSLVKVYRFWEDNATAYMVMPFLQGVTLRDTRRRMAHPPDEAWIRSVITPILSALELLHREGVYHRDIAPDNILLPPDGPPVLLDFGAARRVISDRTQSLTAILKPSYAPIEQYAEMTQLRQGPWTDLYALGAVIHYLLFGAPPAPATARAVQDDTDQIENRIVPGVSPRFLEAVSWMLSIRPNQRPQNGEQLRAVLDGSATIPPRGRPGITIPPTITGAASASAAYEPTRHVDPTVDPTRLQTAHIPTHLPTAHVAPPGQSRPVTFSPTAQMPSPRAGQSQLDTMIVPPPAMAPPQQQPMQAGTRPSEWPASRPATLPPPVPAAAPMARPLAGEAAQPARSRPAPLAASAAAPAVPATGPIEAKRGGSKLGWIVAGVLAVVVVGAAAAWQFVAKHDNAVDAAAAATTAKPPAASVVAPPPTPAVSPAPATPPVAGATVAPLPSAAATVPAAPAVTSTAQAMPDPAKAGAPVATRPPAVATHNDTAGGTSALPAGTDHSVPPVATRNPADASTATLDGSAARPRPAGRPVPRSDVDATVNASMGNPTARPPDSSGYGSTPSERPRPAGTQPSRDPSSSHPVPTTVPAPVPVARAVPAPAVPVDAGPATAREACGRRVFIAMAVCMDERCEEPRYRNGEECIAVLAKKRVREGH
jgi:serine/threonine protein kinase